jgi:hypothetical protein
MIHWYEGIPSADVTLRFFEKSNLDNLITLLNKLNEKTEEYTPEGVRVIPFR